MSVTRSALASEERQGPRDRLTHVEVTAQVSAGLANRFNNMLAILTGQLEMSIKLLGEGKTQPALDSLRQGLQTSEAAAELVRELQSLSEYRPGEPDAIDLVDAVKSARAILLPTLGTGIQWDVIVPEDQVAHVVCDARALTDVISLLAVNASEAMDGSGLIKTTIRTCPGAEGGRHARRNDTNERRVCLLFEDEGDGFSAEAKDRAFEPFYTTKGEDHSGLGLTTAERLISLNGGRISVSGRASIQIELRAAEVKASPAGPLRVLLVDDEEKVLELFSELLRSGGFEVLPYLKPEQALVDAIEQRKFDVIVTDVRMPTMSGPDMVRSIEEHCGVIPTVFATGFAEGAFAEEDSPIDALHAFVQKPFPIRTLVTAINRVVQAASVAGASKG